MTREAAIKTRDVLIKYGKFPGPTEIEMARALYELGQEDAVHEATIALEEMAMKYHEVVRWALKKGAQVVIDRVLRPSPTAGARSQAEEGGNNGHH